MRAFASLLGVVTVAGVALSDLGACAPPDPVHDRAVARLGNEQGSPGELHRAGQPCATCHNAKSGPADSDFSVGGTVFAMRASRVGVEGVRVELTDSEGTSPPLVVTNCAGNFWVTRATWDPVLPIVSVRLSKDTTIRAKHPLIGGAASCADCHEETSARSDPLTKVGAIYLFDDMVAPRTPHCAADQGSRQP